MAIGYRSRRLSALRRAALAALSLAAAACTTLPGLPLVRDEAGCQAWTAQLNAAVAAADVHDAEAEPIAGFPGLRADRTAAALREEAAAGDRAFAAWLARVAELDRAARAAEIGNLPQSTFPLGAATNRAQALARTEGCRDGVLRQLRDAQPGGGTARSSAGAPDPALPAAAAAPDASLRRALLSRATVPDRYSTASRALGLYPLLRWPFFAGVQGWQNEHLADMARWAAAPPPLQRFTPSLDDPGERAEPRGPSAGGADVADSSGNAAASAPGPPPWPPAHDALGLPQPGAADAQRLLAWHTPVFEVEVRGAFDRFGAPRWGVGGGPEVDTRTPHVYQRIAHTRLAGRWLLQLVYTLWFPERPARAGLDLLAGALDGVIVRLTLGEDGQPILMDTIHACGCYHLFFPSVALRPRAGAPQDEEWMFAPAALPPLPPAQRLVVRIASATHYVNGVGAAPRSVPTGAGRDDTPRYVLREEQMLRSLPQPEPMGRRSLYGLDGLVAGSGRGERFLFWPMGIASAGAMRQWGHHATAFVGRRHFDAPDLLDQRFEWVPEKGPAAEASPATR